MLVSKIKPGMSKYKLITLRNYRTALLSALSGWVGLSLRMPIFFPDRRYAMFDDHCLVVAAHGTAEIGSYTSGSAKH